MVGAGTENIQASDLYGRTTKILIQWYLIYVSGLAANLQGWMLVRTVRPCLLLKAISRENHGTDEMSAILFGSLCTYFSSVHIATVWQFALRPTYMKFMKESDSNNTPSQDVWTGAIRT